MPIISLSLQGKGGGDFVRTFTALPPPGPLRFRRLWSFIIIYFKTDSFSCKVCAKKINKNVEEGGGAKQDMNITYVHVLYNRKGLVSAYFPLLGL